MPKMDQRRAACAIDAVHLANEQITQVTPEDRVHLLHTLCKNLVLIASLPWPIRNFLSLLSSRFADAIDNVENLFRANGIF